MLGNVEAFSGFSVPDLKAAQDFYANTLGLTVKEIPMGIELHLGNGTRVFVYPSANNKPADFTILNFVVSDLEASVKELNAKGVHMEKYDMPQIKTDELGIAHSDGSYGPRKIAWFKDPFGNVLSVYQE